MRIDPYRRAAASNLIAALGCSDSAVGYVSSAVAPAAYYPWCKDARGAWTGDLNVMLPEASQTLTLVALQSNMSGTVFTVLIHGANEVMPQQSIFTSVSFVDKDGTPRTLTSASATYSSFNSGVQALWQWAVDPGLFDDAGEYNVTFNP